MAQSEAESDQSLGGGRLPSANLCAPVRVVQKKNFSLVNSPVLRNLWQTYPSVRNLNAAISPFATKQAPFLPVMYAFRDTGKGAETGAKTVYVTLVLAVSRAPWSQFARRERQG